MVQERKLSLAGQANIGQTTQHDEVREWVFLPSAASGLIHVRDETNAGCDQNCRSRLSFSTNARFFRPRTAVSDNPSSVVSRSSV